MLKWYDRCRLLLSKAFCSSLAGRQRVCRSGRMVSISFDLHWSKKSYLASERAQVAQLVDESFDLKKLTKTMVTIVRIVAMFIVYTQRNQRFRARR